MISGGGGTIPSPVPSARTTTWRWTAPRAWYSTTLTNESLTFSLSLDGVVSNRRARARKA